MKPFDPEDSSTFPGAVAETKQENYARFWSCRTTDEQLSLLWEWNIVDNMFAQTDWAKRLEGRRSPGQPIQSPEDVERGRIKREVAERKAAAERVERRAKLEADVARAMTGNDTDREVEARYQLALLDRAAPPPAVTTYEAPKKSGGGAAFVGMLILGIIVTIVLFAAASWLSSIGVAIIIAAFIMRNAGKSAVVVVQNVEKRE